MEETKRYVLEFESSKKIEKCHFIDKLSAINKKTVNYSNEKVIAGKKSHP